MSFWTKSYKFYSNMFRKIRGVESSEKLTKTNTRQARGKSRKLPPKFKENSNEKKNINLKVFEDKSETVWWQMNHNKNCGTLLEEEQWKLPPKILRKPKNMRTNQNNHQSNKKVRRQISKKKASITVKSQLEKN